MATAKTRAGGDPRPSDESVPTGITPRTVIWTRNKTTLYRYQAVGADHPTGPPMLLVYALINRSYVLDLRPGNSFVGHLLAHGHDVYLLDWGSPGWEDRDLTLDTLIGEHLPAAVERMRRESGRNDYVLFGYCMGGTFAAIHAALQPDGVAGLVCLTTPVDFREAGLHRVWTDPRHLDAEALAAGFGNIPSTLIEIGNKLLRPVANFIGVHDTYIELVARGEDIVPWRALNQWVNDGVPFAGAAFVQWIRDFYQRDLLRKGELRLAGESVDLARIVAPLLNITARNDHIVPPAMARPLGDLTSSVDATYLELSGGHVGVLVGRNARERLWPTVTDWLAEHVA